MLKMLLECEDCDNSIKVPYLNKDTRGFIIHKAINIGWSKVYINGHENFFCTKCTEAKRNELHIQQSKLQSKK